MGEGERVEGVIGWVRGLPSPTDWGELVQIHDDREVFQASPDELPAIDVHNRL